MDLKFSWQQQPKLATHLHSCQSSQCFWHMIKQCSHWPRNYGKVLAINQEADSAYGSPIGGLKTGSLMELKRTREAFFAQGVDFFRPVSYYVTCALQLEPSGNAQKKWTQLRQTLIDFQTPGLFSSGKSLVGTVAQKVHTRQQGGNQGWKFF